jgi:uncharacterized MnhB-related membrane protein
MYSHKSTIAIFSWCFLGVTPALGAVYSVSKTSFSTKAIEIPTLSICRSVLYTRLHAPDPLSSPYPRLTSLDWR